MHYVMHELNEHSSQKQLLVYVCFTVFVNCGYSDQLCKTITWDNFQFSIQILYSFWSVGGTTLLSVVRTNCNSFLVCRFTPTTLLFYAMRFQLSCFVHLVAQVNLFNSVIQLEIHDSPHTWLWESCMYGRTVVDLYVLWGQLQLGVDW